MISGRGGAGLRGGRIRPPRRFGRPHSQRIERSFQSRSCSTFFSEPSVDADRSFAADLQILPQPSSEENDVEDCIRMLEEALSDIHNQSCGNLSFEELYRAAYKIVLKKKGDLLYERVKKFEEQWFIDHVIPKIEALVTTSLINISTEAISSTSANERRQMGEKFMKGIRDKWQDHYMSMNMAADVLMYLDRGYTQQDPQRKSIFSTTIALFRDNVLRSRLRGSTSLLVIDILISVILEQINMEREGDVIDRNLIRSCTRMLTSLHEGDEETEGQTIYMSAFHERFLRDSESFYRQECEQLLRNADASTWLRHTQRRLNEERERCETTIELDSLPGINALIERTFISDHLHDFLKMEGSGFQWMIENDKVQDLSILYSLMARIDRKKTALQEMLQKRVVEYGLGIEKALKEIDFSATPGEGSEDAGEGEKVKTLNPAAQQTAAAIKWVEDVLWLRDKFDKIADDCFQKDVLVQSAIIKSFSIFINMFDRSSEFVSLYIDDTLKRGIRGKTEAEVDTTLEKAVILVQYLRDRDLFQTYYQRHVARRLLHNKTESLDVEKQIISQMKLELGQQFTSKFEGMFRDLATSVELTTSYRSRMEGLGDGDGDGAKGIDLHINVLTTNYWPHEIMGRHAMIGEGSRTSCNYPAQVKRLQASFEQFYLSNRNGRKLTWIGSAGSADVRCTFPANPGKQGALGRERRYEINVPTFGMVVLMLFNDLPEGQSLSLEEIQAKTGISTHDLMRTLTAIAVAPKSRVLAKTPATKSIKAGDTFAFNETFQSKTLRIKAPIINAVSKVEDKQERKSTEEKNTQARSHIIDAAIVRIMKSRKELSHSQLVSEVLSQLTARFKPEVSLIKKRIEDLIVREYLERPDEEEAPSTYRYVA